ncbi:hypothetical protein ABB02_01356 [Clostridiaceae bacterium JG1575]|nr:hypothetical protein ABB02_01356 [Clostridiaceae bacterium JG1575]
MEKGIRKRPRGARGLLLGILLAMACFFMATPRAWANSAEPPRFLLEVVHAPKEFTLTHHRSLGDPGAFVTKKERLGQIVYAIYSSSAQDVVLTVQSGKETKDLILKRAERTYNTKYTLDGRTLELKLGQDPTLKGFSVALRLLTTLGLEGLVFYFMGYRRRSSWGVFFLVNLITQAGVFLFMKNATFWDSYLELGYVFMELCVLLLEMVLFPVFLKEQEKRKAVAYAFFANLVSLFAGGMLLRVLPL